MSSIIYDSDESVEERGRKELLHDESEDKDEEEDDVCQDLKEAIEEFETAVYERGYEAVPEYYDVLFHFCRRKTGRAFEWAHRLSILETLPKAYDSMKSSLMKFISRSLNNGESRSEEDAEEAEAFSEHLLMILDLVKAVMCICEDEINHRAYRVCTYANGTSLEAAALCSEEEDIDTNILQCYDILKRKVLEMFHSICTFSVPGSNGSTVRAALRYLWQPAEVDKELVSTIASTIIKFMEHPKFGKKSAKDRADLREFFMILRYICVSFNHQKVVARLFVSTTMDLEHLKNPNMTEKFPFIVALKSVSVDGDLDRLLYYIYYFALDSLHRYFLSGTSNPHIPRPYILFVESMAEVAPEIFAENIAPLIPLLNFDPHTLRGSILSAFCKVLMSDIEKTRFSAIDQNMAIIRERIMEEIKLHLSDTALQVRSKAVGYCVEIAQCGKVPEVSLRKGLVNAVAERLTEKMAVIRRSAIRFFKYYLINNAYGENHVAKQFFNSISTVLRVALRRLIEDHRCTQPYDLELEKASLEEVMQLIVNQLFFADSVQTALETFVKLFHLGRLSNINSEQSKDEIVDSLMVDLRQRFLNAPKELIGGCDENDNVVASSVPNSPSGRDYLDRELRLLEDAFILHDQMAKVLCEVVRSIAGKDLADVHEALPPRWASTTSPVYDIATFRGSEGALLELYRKVEDISEESKMEVISGIESIFVARKTDGKVDVPKTALSLLKRLKQSDEILETKSAEDRVLVMKALAVLTIGNRTVMRQHVRDFQKYIRSSDVVLACEALRALSNLIPIQNGFDSKIHRLRVFDSMFVDVEKLLFKVLLSDGDAPASTCWYTCARNAVRLLFALSSEVDYVISRVLGKAIWYAKKAADLLIAYESIEQKPSEPAGNRRMYWNLKWQRTMERTLMLIGEVVEGLLLHVSSSFRDGLKRVAELSETVRKSNDETYEDYGCFDMNRSEVETDFAYEEGIFNLRPTNDGDVEILATIPGNQVIVRVKQEDFDESGENGAIYGHEMHGKTSTDESEEEKAQTNPTTVDDLIRTHLSTLLESSLLRPDGTMGVCLSFVVSCMRTAKYSKAIRDAATRTFSKFLLISPHLAERGASFLFTVLSCDEEPHMREYLLASGVDLLHRFPTMLENYALFIYKMANDEDFSVRLTAILYLTHLLCKDILKPRGCLSDVALSMLPSKSFTGSSCGGREVAAAACNLFNELSKKLKYVAYYLQGNLLVNVLPDIICRLSRYGEQVPMDAFQALVRRFLSMLGDKSHDVMVEKMCHRFDFCGSEEAIENNENIAHYFSYFISQLNLSEKSLQKMCDFLPHFAPFLDDDVVFNNFSGVVRFFIESDPSPTAKDAADGLLRKMEYLHRKSTLTEAESKKILKNIGYIDLEIPVKLDAKGDPIVFNFDDCEQPVEYDST
ncbi:hypothetical protein ANCCAN_06825 [Ancylostoma caninum]|uniref:Condensin complex subunit 1 C-terminal domain-containing protein n=1 Tax=Ancylostoma caninum TaxID=29170 RepID=A0A368GRU6_ANCCA|nr:hypothetical protein ANCCAN_06825 [Ancylostoma caninum]